MCLGGGVLGGGVVVEFQHLLFEKKSPASGSLGGTRDQRMDICRSPFHPTWWPHHAGHRSADEPRKWVGVRPGGERTLWVGGSDWAAVQPPDCFHMTAVLCMVVVMIK